MKTKALLIWSQFVSVLKRQALQRGAVCLAFLGVLTLPTPARAADSFNFRGRFANAVFRSTDPTGCIVTVVFVTVTEGRLHNPPGPPSASVATDPVATVRIAQDDYCTSAYLHAFGEATLTDETFQVNKELTSASLNATVLVINDAHDLFAYDVDLALTWTGTGELVRQSDRFHFHASDFSFQSRSNGTFRDAVASGSVSLAASLGDTNLTPQASMDAQIGSVKSGTLSLQK